MDDYAIEYWLPANSEISFETKANCSHLKLLSGLATLWISGIPKSVALQIDYALPANERRITLQTITECCFTVVKNYCAWRALYAGSGDKCEIFRGCQDYYGSFTFILQRETRLQIFVSDLASEFDVSTSVIEGKAEIFGYQLLPERKYPLLPCSSVVLVSSDDEECHVGIHGKNRRIKVSLLEQNTRQHMKSMLTHIHTLRLQAKEDKRVGPTILVVGQISAGKTSFCHFLLNKALDDGMNPVYVDLDFRRNSNAIPGAISLAEIRGRLSVFLGFANYSQSILQLGDIELNISNIHLYYLLIRRMGELLTAKQEISSKRYSGAVIDVCGYLGEDISTIDCILQSFTVDLVVFVGDDHSFDLLNSSLRTKRCEFVPRSLFAEPLQENWETKIRQNTLRKYFYGRIDRPMRPSIFEAKFADFEIYKVVNKAPDRKTTDARLHDFNIAPVICHPFIEYYVLGVSKATSVDVHLPVTEIEYFVCFSKVDMEKETVTVLSLASDLFIKKILLMGDIKLN